MSTRFRERLVGVADDLRTVGWFVLWVTIIACVVRVIIRVGNGDWRALPFVGAVLLLWSVAWVLRRVAGWVRAHDGA